MILTKNFTLEELTRTDTGLPNHPEYHEQQKLLYLATYILQPIRDAWGIYRINSGYRSEEVNGHPDVQGSDDSQHLFAEAVDGYPVNAEIEKVFEWIVRVSKIVYGQCILETVGESTWLHISLPRIGRENKEAMQYENGNYSIYR